MTKVMIVNGGPRKNFNTAKMLKKVKIQARRSATELSALYARFR